ncbi:Protein kinase C-binding protein 1 [Acanthosepion pharaonis]|uniref:Protein kinase C-binding protein 1 n=1 Tax=Acanthosepion pharaonis TaxID=158019 RepID=A0A812C5S5_ACAPH|nr:Protein kinase C-binding protein 1 [Sepia pharaonis]
MDLKGSHGVKKKHFWADLQLQNISARRKTYSFQSRIFTKLNECLSSSHRKHYDDSFERKCFYDKISGTDSGNEGSAKTSGSNSSTPVMSSNCSIRTRASTGVISGSISKTDIKSEGCPSPSSDTCSSRSGTPQSFKRTRGKIDDLYIVQIPPKKQKIGRNDGTGVNNKNDYFCWICHRDGVMIFCELCPRVYHIKCLGLEESPSEWVCPECERIMRAECVDTRSKSMSMITQEQFCALLKHALTRMKHQTSSPFRQPVDLCAVPNYHDFIYHPMDLTTIEKNIKNDKYGSTEAFLADVKWILHNCIIFNGTHHKLTGSAKMILKICKHEMTEIEICPDCYARSCEQTTEEWFCEPCNNPHRIVWAKLKGYPFWPAKALREKNGMVDVRFFGAHDRSWVPISQVYAYSKECPTVMRSKRSGFDYSMSELKRYIEKYKEKFGSFEYAPFRTFQNFHRMVKNSSLSISASGNAHSKDGEISAHQKTVEIISPVLTTKKGKANSSTNGHLFEGENKMSIVQSPQKRNTLKSVSDSNSLSAFRPPPKNQNTITDIQRTLSDPQMTVMEPNSSSCEIAKSSNRKILMPKIGSLSAINRRSLEDCSTDSENSKSNLSLPTATTEATLLLGLLKNKINSNVNSASTSSCSTTSGPMSGGSSNPARNDISRPVEINQLVEKYTKQLSKNIQESFEEMYADMLTKHSHQVIMKHYHQELEKLRWIHEQEIAEIKHNTNLIVAEIRASWENEKERYGNSIREQCEIEKIKSVEETKKKQWCANCGKEALLYCCWNTSYCDYQCQANHWPQHMTSCTQQLPQSTQVTQLTVPTPVMTTATSNPSGTLVNPAPQGVVALSEVLTKTNNSNTTTPVVIPNLRQQQQQQQPPLPPPQQQPPPPPPPPVSTNAQLPEIKSVETLNTTATPKFSTRASGMLQQIVKKEEIRPKMMNLQPVSTTVSGPTQIQFVPTSLAQSTGGSIQVLPAPSTQVRMQTVQLQSASLPSTLQGQSSFPSIIANPQPVVATAAISSTTNTKMNTITVPTVTSSAPKNIKPNATTKNILIPPGSFILTKAPQGQLQLNAKQM